MGDLVTYKVTSDQTGGAYSLFEVASQPGAGPPPHVQHREDEAFYVLVAVSSGHRAEAFEAGREGIERIKGDVPIWKKERLESGEAEWVMGS